MSSGSLVSSTTGRGNPERRPPAARPARRPLARRGRPVFALSDMADGRRSASTTSCWQSPGRPDPAGPKTGPTARRPICSPGSASATGSELPRPDSRAAVCHRWRVHRAVPAALLDQFGRWQRACDEYSSRTWFLFGGSPCATAGALHAHAQWSRASREHRARASGLRAPGLFDSCEGAKYNASLPQRRCAPASYRSCR